MRRLAHKAASSDDLIDHEAGLIGRQLKPLLSSDFIYDGVKNVAREGQAAAFALYVENVPVVFKTGCSDFDFVGKTAQKGCVHQVFGIEVGGENNQFLERNAESFAGMQLEVVETAFERHDPAVEQVGGADELAAEVVDDEAAAESLQMERRLVEMSCGVVAQVEHFKREFATGENERAFAGHPARVVFLSAEKRQGVLLGRRCDANRDVNAGVVDADDLAIDTDGVGHVDDVAENVAEAVRDGGFAITGGTVEEHGAPGIESRAALLHNTVVEGKACKGGANAFEGDDFVGQLLQAHLVGELLQGDGRRPNVALAIQGVDREVLAPFGESVAHVNHAVGIVGAQGAQQLAVDGHLHEIEHKVVGQLDGVDELAVGFKPPGIDEFHQQAEQIAIVEASGRKIGGFGGDAMDEGLERALRNSPDHDEVLAEPPTESGLAFKRLGDIVLRDQLDPHQQVA